MEFIDSNHLLAPEQFGFRPQHSTTGQILRIAEIASQGLQSNEPTGAVFLDLAKAFDKIPHTELIYKLIKLRIPDPLIHLLHSYLGQRLFTVRVQNSYSTHRPISSGVLQGSCLGPLCFLLYINDCPRYEHTTLALYADDTACIASAPHPDVLAGIIQTHLDMLEEYFSKWKLRLNPSKCQAIYFSRRRGDPPRLYLNDEVINWENTAKYLGLTLDRRLTWKPHIKNVIEKMKTKAGMLAPLFCGPHLSDKNKVLLFKTVILPTATYASPTWSYAAKSNINLIERFQNKMLRRFRRAWRFLRNSVIRRDYNVPTFKRRARELSLSFYDSLQNIPNEIIAEIPDYDFSDPANFRRPRASMLDTG